MSFLNTLSTGIQRLFAGAASIFWEKDEHRFPQTIDRDIHFPEIKSGEAVIHRSEHHHLASGNTMHLNRLHFEALQNAEVSCVVGKGKLTLSVQNDNSHALRNVRFSLRVTLDDYGSRASILKVTIVCDNIVLIH